jgi:hypothetical protein
MGRLPKQDADTFQLTSRETLSGKDYTEYLTEVIQARNDPVYFIEEILGFPGTDEFGNTRHLFPVQEQIVREFYRHKYDLSYEALKKMVYISGQRCLSHESSIKTQNGDISLEDLYPKNIEKIENKFINLNDIKVFNGNNWVDASHIIYCGRKPIYELILENGYTVKSSKEHRYKTKYGWKELQFISIGEYIQTDQDFIPVKSIKYTRELDETYDLHIPDGNCYISDGILSHNSGKTALISTIMAYELFEVISWESPAKHYGLMTGKSGKGATIGITCLATSTKQANYGVFANMTNLMKENEWFDTWFPDLIFKNEMIESPSKNVIAQVIAPKASTAAGYTNKCAIFDELDFFIESETLLDVYSVFNKVCNSTDTFKRDGKIIAISSLNTMNGIMMKEYRETQRESRKLHPMSIGFMYETWVANPTLTKEYLMESCANDYAKFLKDYANHPEAAAGVQFPEGIILNKSLHNVLYEDLNDLDDQILNHERVLSLDPAWKHDRFGMACGYREDNTIYVDGVRGFSKGDSCIEEAYLRPSDIRNFLDSIIHPLHITSVVYDVQNLAPELIEHLEHDIGLATAEHIPKKIDYDRWRELQDGIYPTNLEITYDEILEKECLELIIKNTPGGKAKVDHVDKKSSKDIADAVANTIWYLESDDRIDLNDLHAVARGYVI